MNVKKDMHTLSCQISCELNGQGGGKSVNLLHLQVLNRLSQSGIETRK